MAALHPSFLTDQERADIHTDLHKCVTGLHHSISAYKRAPSRKELWRVSAFAGWIGTYLRWLT